MLALDRPWEGWFSTFATVIRDRDRYRMYYRGQGVVTGENKGGVVCYAESADGVQWTKPSLG